MADLSEKLDAHLGQIFAEWNLVSTILALIILAALIYPIVFPDEPDTHPLLLARQSQASPIRNKNESAVYRSPEVPHGYPLRTGLNVKTENDPKWTTGKDGDVRDIWREVQRGGRSDSAGKQIPKGAIITVFGREDVVEHSIDDLSREIAIIGAHLKASGAQKVAIYLPNSVEYLLTVFACAFYGLTPVLLPYNQTHAKIYETLNELKIDAIVASAGNIPLVGVASACAKLRSITWVVENTSRHMDWNGVPEEFQNRLKSSVWHDLVETDETTTAAALANDQTGGALADLISVWQPANANAKPQYVTLTQANIVAGVGALISALPLRSRYSSADLVLPANTFSHQYVLCQTFAALFSHASLAISSVAEPGVDLALACRFVSPTIIIASAESLVNLHVKALSSMNGVAQKFANHFHTRSVTAGRMPVDNWIFKLIAPAKSAFGNAPGTLRLILTSERLGAGTPALTSSVLSDLRIFTRARICYALTSSRVAGAVAQTHIFDYRTGDSDGHSHFGLPLSSVELKVISTDDSAVGSTSPEGKLVVTGPAVSGRMTQLDVRIKIGVDGTIAYA